MPSGNVNRTAAPPVAARPAVIVPPWASTIPFAIYRPSPVPPRLASCQNLLKILGNVSTRADELPVETATSLALAGGSIDREIVTREVLRGLARRYRGWLDRDGAPGSVIPAYRERCETIGLQIELLLPEGDIVRGTAIEIDDGGRLVVRDEATGVERAWLVGDVTHVRKVS